MNVTGAQEDIGMKIEKRRLLQDALLAEQMPEEENAKQEVSQSLTVRQIWKQELEKMYDPAEDMTQEEHAEYQQKLMAKIKSGKKLSSQEMNYLRVHDPVAYQLARRMEYKRLKLERKLKLCKSKEEVEEVFYQAMEGISKNDPDRETIMATYQEAFQEFKKTLQYARLPETKREAKAEQLHGKRKKAFLAGKDFAELEMDIWFDPAKQDGQEEDGLEKLDEAATPLDELLDSMPVMDIVG